MYSNGAQPVLFIENVTQNRKLKLLKVLSSMIIIQPICPAETFKTATKHTVDTHLICGHKQINWGKLRDMCKSNTIGIHTDHVPYSAV